MYTKQDSCCWFAQRLWAKKPACERKDQLEEKKARDIGPGLHGAEGKDARAARKDRLEAASVIQETNAQQRETPGDPFPSKSSSTFSATMSSMAAVE